MSHLNSDSFEFMELTNRTKQLLLPIGMVLVSLGCGLTRQNVAPTAPAAITATPLGEGPALPDLYPLSSGAVWTYHAAIDTDNGSGPQHWEGSITETVIETTLVGDQEVYHIQLAGHPTHTT